MHSSHSLKLIATIAIAMTMTMGSSRLAAQSSEISNFATGEFIDWATLQAFPPDPQDITGPLNVLDWTGAAIAHDANYFYLRYTEAGSTRTTWAQTIYLDTDSNPSTGLQSGLAIGADHLIQGRLIYTYTGDATGSVWSWEHTGSMNGLSSADLITTNWRFDRDAIGNPSSFDLAFVGSNEAYGGDTEDLYPDGVYSEKSNTRFFTYSTAASGNTAPQAIQPDIIRTQAGTPVQITLEGSDPDGDQLTFQLVFDPLEGTISGTAPTLTYTPRPGFSGFDLIGFIVNDGTSESAETSISIEVIGDGAPYGADQYLITDENVPIDIYLDGTDPDGQPLTYTILDAPTAPVGTLQGTAPNLTFVPAAGFAGMTAVLYTVSDGVLVSEPSLIDIDVLPALIINEPDSQIIVDGNLSDWSEYDSIINDATGDVPGSNNPIDFISAAASYDSFAVYFAYENKEVPLSRIDAWGFNIYLDTDADPISGFTDGMNIGSEYLLQGASLYKYTGNGTSWEWEYIGDGMRAVNGTTAEVTINLDSLGNPPLIDYVLIGDNLSLGGDRQDFYPDGIYNPKSGNRSFSLFVDDDLSDPFADADDPFADGLTYDAAKEEPISGERGIFADAIQPSIQARQSGTGIVRTGGGGSGILWLLGLSGLALFRRSN